jgi:amino acid transporter
MPLGRWDYCQKRRYKVNTEKTPPQPVNITLDRIEELVTVSEVYQNVSLKVIIITEDKVRLCLSEHLKRMEKRGSWITPLGLLISIIVTLVTSDFKNVGIDAATWKALFIITGLISFGWLIYSIKEAWQSAKIEDIIDELKKGSESRTNDV